MSFPNPHNFDPYIKVYRQSDDGVVAEAFDVSGLGGSSSVQTGTTPLVNGQGYVDVVFGSEQANSDWENFSCRVVNVTDVSPLCIIPGTIVQKSATGCRILLSGAPDSDNYVLQWAVGGETVSGTATTYTLTGPTAGKTGSLSTNFTAALHAGQSVASPVTITPDDAGGGGTFTPSSVMLTTGSPSATFKYTPATSGTKTISTTNDGGLTDPASLPYEAAIVLDHFTDADAVNVVDHTMDIGSGWTKLSGASAETSIVVGKATSQVDPANAYIYVSDSGVADGVVTGVFNFGVADSSHYCELIVRASDSSNYYRLSLAGGGADGMTIRKIVAGVETIIAQQVAVVSAGVDYLFTATLSGNSITFLVGAFPSLNVTDAFNNTATKHGFLFYHGSFAPNTLDDLKVV